MAGNDEMGMGMGIGTEPGGGRNLGSWLAPGLFRSSISRFHGIR